MRQFKTLWKGMAAALAGGLLLCACSSEEEAALTAEGKGLVRIGLSADTGFSTQTKAVDESEYENLENYTVQIWKDGRIAQDGDGNDCEWIGNALPQDGLIELDNGDYTLLAYTGETYKGNGATTEGMYVEGSNTFNINANQISVSATCIPQCARMTVVFDSKMADYFSDYSVTFSGTTALGSTTYTWKKDFTDPVYMAVTGTETITATINLTDKESKIGTPIVKTYKVSAAKAVKMNIVPTVQGGNVGISIEIDDSTNDIPIDIEIPSNWL